MMKNQIHEHAAFCRSTLSGLREGILIDATRGVQITSFVDELIQQRLELPYQTLHSGMRQNANRADDRKPRSLGHASYGAIVGQHRRGFDFKRTGNHRTVCFRKVRRRESLNHRPIGHRNDGDPVVLNALLNLSFPGTAAPLGDHFIDHVRNGRHLLEEVLEQVKLMNHRQMNERAAVCDDRHGREVEGKCCSVSISLASHPSE